jgi:hypothetical protein
MANVVIDIAAEFTGNKAFKQAETSTEKLTKNVKKLAGAVGLAFGTAQVIAYGKASVKASLEAQAQQERLANLVKVTVGATAAQVQALNEQADALQAIGVVNKENITQTQSQLATFNLQIDTIKALTPAILDYVTAEKGASASADQFKQMTNGLAQALNGNFASLTKVGFVLDDVTKKTIKEGTETERAAALVKVLDSTYKDFNKNLANTPTGQMQKLANAADDAKQIIGTGLLDALTGLGEDDSIQNLANNMAKFATETANVIRGIGILAEKLKSIPGASGFMQGLQDVYNISYIKLLSNLGKVTAAQKSSDNAHLKSLNYQFFVLRKTETLTKKLTAEELKKLKAKQLQNAIDKANLALNKGTDVFDMDKIQNAAALTNQAELLGKATTGSQLLQIANDTARLNVKKSILALEDAIASKDEAAIASATTKLNADLKILNTLTGQSLQMASIQSILAGLVPKDLVNQKNLDDALDKIREMLALLGKAALPDLTTAGKAGGTSGGKAGGTSGGLSGGKSAAQLAQDAALAEFFKNKLAEEAAALAAAGRGIAEEGITGQIIEHIAAGSDIDAILEYADAATARANAIASLLEGNNAAGMAALTTNALANAAYGFQSFQTAEAAAFLPTGNGSIGGGGGAFDRDINITVNTGVGDPNAIAEAIENLLREANSRGTLTSGLLNIG